MKKLVFALVLGLLLVAAFATTALADNGPHGGFNGSTNACASCHRAHSAISADGFLLVANDVFTLCTNCHDGTGAYTNVVDGYYDVQVGDPGKAAFPGGAGDAGLGLFGGGFVNTRMLTDYGNQPGADATTNTGANINTSATSWAQFNAYDTVALAPVARATTSTHTVDGLGASTGAGTIWGSNNYNVAADVWTGVAGSQLECTNCHNPHGNAGRNAAGQPVPSYRLLNYTPGGSNGYEVTTQTGTTGYWDTDMTWGTAAGAPLTGTAVVPSAAGVLVPDRTVKWYSVNNDITLDGMLGAYRGRVGSGEIMVANFAGQGDYMGRYYGYQRPAGAVTAATTGTVLSCRNGSGVPTVPGTACPPTAGTAFNNLVPHDVLGFWCSTCHDRYLAPGGSSRTTDSGDAQYHYRHRSQTTGTGLGGGQYTCMDCHASHGTSAQADALSGDASYAKGSVLLKGDNRAVCIRCHAGAVNFFNVTTSPTAPMVLP